MSPWPRWCSGEEPACQCRRRRDTGVIPGLGRFPWRMAWPPTAVLLPGRSHGQRSLAGYSPWSLRELDTTEWLILLLGKYVRYLAWHILSNSGSLA